MKRITITVSKATAEALTKLAAECREKDKARNGATSHGPLTSSTLLAIIYSNA